MYALSVNFKTEQVENIRLKIFLQSMCFATGFYIFLFYFSALVLVLKIDINVFHDSCPIIIFNQSQLADIQVNVRSGSNFLYDFTYEIFFQSAPAHGF